MSSMEGSIWEEIAPRHIPVLILAARGMNCREIGAVLGLSHQVARNYISEILKRTGCADRLELAVRIAQERQDYERKIHEAL